MLDEIEKFAQKILDQLKLSKQNNSWNVQELSERSGLSVQAIYSLASGQRGHEPEFRTIFALASGMGWTIEDFVSEITTKKNYKIDEIKFQNQESNSITIQKIINVLIDMPIKDSYKIKILKAANS